MNNEIEENFEIDETVVPISIDNLKKYFENKNIKFLIDYDNSNLKDDKFLTYIGNLDIPCDIKIDLSNDEHLKLIKQYMNAKTIVNLPSLEKEVLEICLEAADFGFEEKKYEKFIEDNTEIISTWLDIFRSMGLYNTFTMADKENKLKENYVLLHEKKTTDRVAINFVNLLKYEDTCLLFQCLPEEKLYYYEDFFNEYLFNGNNLFHYWQNPNNNLFLLTWCVSSGKWAEMVEEGKVKNLKDIFKEETGETNDTPV